MKWERTVILAPSDNQTGWSYAAIEIVDTGKIEVRSPDGGLWIVKTSREDALEIVRELWVEQS
jgi:hypothetical protein